MKRTGTPFKFELVIEDKDEIQDDEDQGMLALSVDKLFVSHDYRRAEAIFI